MGGGWRSSREEPCPFSSQNSSVPTWLPLCHPALVLPVSRPWQSPRVGCKGLRTDGHSRPPPAGVDPLLHDLAAGCIPWGGIPGLSKAGATACSWGGSSEGSQGEQLLLVLLPGTWLCTQGVGGSCREPVSAPSEAQAVLKRYYS